VLLYIPGRGKTSAPSINLNSATSAIQQVTGIGSSSVERIWCSSRTGART